jgi:6-phosphogluconolactonase
MKRFSLCFALALIGSVGAVDSARVADAEGRYVYTMTNETSGNELVRYRRTYRGQLNEDGRFATKGRGTSTGLGNQGGIVASPNGRFLFLVNAGSNQISSFRIREFGKPELITTISSGGVRPVSVTVHRNLLYVVNSGDASTPSSIVGFNLNREGSIRQIESSSRPLSAAITSPAQISFSRAGDALVVTEKATNAITTFSVDKSTGLAQAPVTVKSSGMTPFGFTFGRRNTLIVSEAFGGTASALSSYRLKDDDALLTPISSSVMAPDEKAACWVDLTQDRRFAFVTNTATDSISRYKVDRFNGSLSLDEARATKTEGGPIDLDVVDYGTRLYVLNGAGDSIQTFKVDYYNGALSLLGTTSNVPAHANGLIVP